MPPHQIAVGDPGAVAPGKRGGGLSDVGIGGPDIGDGRQHDGIKPVRVQPVLEIEPPRRFQPFQPVPPQPGRGVPARPDRPSGLFHPSKLRAVRMKIFDPIGIKSSGKS